MFRDKMSADTFAGLCAVAAVCAAVIVPVCFSQVLASPDNASHPVDPVGRVWCLKDFKMEAGVMVDEYRGCYADISKAAESCAAVKSSCYLVALEIGQ